jgi:hypothetical protein
MPDAFDWLPALVDLEGFANDWARCRDRLYGVFHRDFVASQPELFGKRIGVNKSRILFEREAAFHHCTTEGDEGTKEEERVPSYGRCQRLQWIRRVIEAAGTDRACWWREVEERRGRVKRRVYVVLPDFSYVVVLEEMTSHLVLVTAFPVEEGHSRRRLARRHAEASDKG